MCAHSCLNNFDIPGKGATLLTCLYESVMWLQSQCTMPWVTLSTGLFSNTTLETQMKTLMVLH